MGETIRRKCLEQLQHDYKDRVPDRTPQNPIGEPELTLLEPAQFDSKQELLDALLQFSPGKEDLMGKSTNGVHWDQISDYCIAFRVPAHVCYNISGTKSFVKVSIAQLD